MAIEFVNPVTAGVTLIREAVQSQNFAAGSAGWQIAADGSAEFNNVVIRGGTVVSGLALYYNGTPGPGTLIMSIAAAAGTDAYGNAYRAGVGVYGTADTVTVQSSGGDTVQLRADAPSYLADAAAPGVLFRKSGETGDGASITEYDDTFTRGLLLLSPSPTTGGDEEDFSFIGLEGRFSGDGPAVRMVAGGPDGAVWVQSMLVDPTGVITSYAESSFYTYTPVFGSTGGATYSNRSGWWMRVGKMVFFNAYAVVSGAGSGGSNVTVTAPTAIDRTDRQVVTANLEGMTAGNNGSGTAVAFTTGGGSTFDRLRNSTGGNIVGSDITSSSIIAVQGWYWEA